MTKEAKNIEPESYDINPELAKLRSQNPFSIPENYFEHLPQEIQNRKSISSMPLSSVMASISGRVVGYAVGLTICACIFVTSLFLFNNSGNQSYLATDIELFYVDYLNWYSDYLQVDIYEFTLAENNWSGDVSVDVNNQVFEYFFSYSFYDYSFWDDYYE